VIGVIGGVGQSQRDPERGTLPGRQAVQAGEDRAEQLVQTGERQRGLGLAADRSQHPMAGAARPPHGEIEQDALADTGFALDDQHRAVGPVGGDALHDGRGLGLPAQHRLTSGNWHLPDSSGVAAHPRRRAGPGAVT
jgi:hypothetical protein